MKLFQQIIAVFFAGLILINSNGLLVNTHSCIAKICADNQCGSSWTSEKKDACCSVNTAEKKEESNCCSSETKFVKAAQTDVLELNKKAYTFSKTADDFPGFAILSYPLSILSPAIGKINSGSENIPFTPSVSAKDHLRFLQVWRC